MSVLTLRGGQLRPPLISRRGREHQRRLRLDELLVLFHPRSAEYTLAREKQILINYQLNPSLDEGSNGACRESSQTWCRFGEWRPQARGAFGTAAEISDRPHA